uniref:solute carrier family 25 member 44-like n=1 Tax=Pristiophorus japonicus TaxID=55135 RepID=UPI00398EAF0D
MHEKRNIQIIGWEDLDKTKFYSFGILMNLSLRLGLYPAMLIRTRLQVQKGKSHYEGTYDALFKILRTEGMRGLYRGFSVNVFTIVASQAYITTYELVRTYVSNYSDNNAIKSFVAGGLSALIAQSFAVPIDNVSQHMMVAGHRANIGRFKLYEITRSYRQAFGLTREVISQIFRNDGPGGFYRGYLASLMTYIPNSALWWPFYHFFAEQLFYWAPGDCPHLVLQGMAAPLAAATASTITNPMDVVRARVQVGVKSSMIETFRQLLREEGAGGLTKGLSARILSTAPASLVLVLCYETLKRISLRPERVESRHC